MSTLKVNTINAATSGQAVAVDVQNPRSNRNLIINGAMEIDQRNGGSSITPTSDNTYTLDRFKARLNVASKYSVQKVSEAPSGFNSSLKVTSAAATTVSATHHYQICSAIEGYDSNKLDLGLSTAKQFTLSFWVKSSLTGTFGGAYSNNSGNRFYAWTYTISSANTWEKKSITITGATDGTWEKTNGAGLFIYWTLGAGTDLQTSAGSWGTTFKRGPSGATNIVETSGATWQITGVQLEVGDVATDFEHRLYGDELARCQRYYYVHVSGANKPIGTGTMFNSAQVYVHIDFPQTMRTAPSLVQNTGTDYYEALCNGSNDTFNDFDAVWEAGLNNAIIVNYNDTSLTAGGSAMVKSDNASGKIAFNSEF